MTLERHPLDSVRFVLDKKLLAKRGAIIDIASLVRKPTVNSPDEPERDVRDVPWTDVTRASDE